MIPDTSRAAREKRLVFMEFGYEPIDYRVFDALPRYPGEARAVADWLLQAAGDPGPHSNWMWRDGSWSNTYRAFGADEELSELNANLR